MARLSTACKTQSDIGPDGGGIRGYESLLILRDLRNKIVDEEKASDETTFIGNCNGIMVERVKGFGAILSQVEFGGRKKGR